MIIYNVTVNIEESVEQEWVSWMKNKHIPDVLNTGHFTGHKFLKLLNEQEEAQGTTYCIQYFCDELDQLEAYLEKDAAPMQKEHTEKYKDKFVAFRTFLETVD